MIIVKFAANWRNWERRWLRRFRPRKNPPGSSTDGGGDKSEKTITPEKGIEYTVQQGDTLSAIAQACKDKKIKVTVDQIVKANPGLKPDKMRPGQKLFIPALPQP